MPSITRRRLVGAGAALAASAYGVGRLVRGAAAGSFASWTPAAGTWPLRRHDPANTAHSPTASPPRERPTVGDPVAVATDAASPRFAPVVGSDHVALYGSGLVVSSRGGREAVHADGVAAPFAGFGPDGRLYATHTAGDGPDPSLSLVEYDADLRESARHSLGDDDPVGLVVGERELYVGAESGVVWGVDADGGRRWSVDGALPALADGRLYAADASLDGTVCYRARSGPDRRLEPGPARLWSAGPTAGFAHAPAVADGRLVVGSRASGGGVVRALDATTGEPLWEPRSLGRDVATPAVVGDRGYAAVADDREAGRVVSLDLVTGETVWRDAVEWRPVSAAVGGDTLVVAGEDRADGSSDGARVRAYDRETGDELWTRAVSGSRPGGIALVGERVFLTVGASLYELR